MHVYINREREKERKLHLKIVLGLKLKSNRSILFHFMPYKYLKQ